MAQQFFVACWIVSLGHGCVVARSNISAAARLSRLKRRGCFLDSQLGEVQTWDSTCYGLITAGTRTLLASVDMMLCGGAGLLWIDLPY